MDVATRVGLVELAVGAVLGWAVAAQSAMPGVLARVGVREPRRILQAHLDYIVMGLILIAIGLALPQLPTWLILVLIFGTWINPTLFVPMAFDSQVAQRLWFQVISVVSFTATSGSLAVAAVIGLRR